MTRPIPNWLLVMLLPIGLIVLIPSLWMFSSFTAAPVFPDTKSIPAVPGAVSPEWVGAVEQARQAVRAGVAEQNLPGLSVAVGMAGEVVWAEGFGYADLGSSVPVTPEHRFQIGTASAVLTSAAAGLLLENGRLKLDEEIQVYLPAFPKKAQPVTLANLMAHAPGVVPDDGDEPPLYSRHCERAGEVLEHYSGNWLLFDEVENQGHSIYDWILVSAAIEAAAGQPFLTHMRERIFDPIGMRNTVADPTVGEGDGEDFPPIIRFRELVYDPRTTRDKPDPAAQARTREVVTAYGTRFRSDPNYGMYVARPVDSSCYAGSSGFVSTPSDLVRFGMAVNGGKVLQPATVALLQNGLGWEVKTVEVGGEPKRAAGIDGDSRGGRVATLLTFPESGMAVAVTSNISSAETVALAEAIAQVFAKQ